MCGTSHTSISQFSVPPTDTHFVKKAANTTNMRRKSCSFRKAMEANRYNEWQSTCQSYAVSQITRNTSDFCRLWPQATPCLQSINLSLCNSPALSLLCATYLGCSCSQEIRQKRPKNMWYYLAVWYCPTFPYAFLQNAQVSLSCRLLGRHAVWLCCFTPADGGSKSLRKDGFYLEAHTALQSRRRPSPTTSPPLEPEIS
jgi:hypothetical protein